MDYELLTSKVDGLSNARALSLILNHYKILINQAVYAAALKIKDANIKQYETRVNAVFVTLEVDMKMVWTDRMVAHNIEEKIVDYIYPAEVSIFRAVAPHTKFPDMFTFKKRIERIMTDLCAQLSYTIRLRKE